MGYERCLAQIRKLAGADLSDEDIGALLERLIAERNRIAADPREAHFLDQRELIRRAGESLANQERLAAAKERRNAAMNLGLRIARRAFYERAPSLELGMEAKLVGVNTPFEGARLSVDAQGRSLTRDYLGGLGIELERAGFDGTVRHGDLDEQWAAELYELNRTEGQGRPGITGSREALAIAKIVRKYQRLAVDNLNRAGAWISDYDGWIARTSHDPDKIRRAGFEAWRDAIAPLLDERTFDGIEDRQLFLKRIYNAFVTGVHLTSEGVEGFRDPVFRGPGNLAKRLSQARVLHFKDAAGWLAYHRQFARGSLIETVLQGLQQAARSTALMREFGTNPRYEFEADLRYLEQTYRDTDTAAVNRLNQRRKALANRFDEVDGTASTPVNRQLATIGTFVRLQQTMAKLGGVLLSSLTDIPFKAAELRYQGIGFLEGYRDGLVSIARGRGSGETREIMDALRAGTEGMIGDIARRFDGHDTPVGIMSKSANFFFKLTGLAYWTDAQKAGAELLMSRRMGQLRGRGFEALPAETRRLLELYDIGPEAWRALNRVEWRQANGRSHLTPDKALDLTDEQVLPLIKDELELLGQGLGTRYAKRLEANSREAEWAQKRLAKFEAGLEAARERLAAIEKEAEARGAMLDAGLRDRMALLEERFHEARRAVDLNPAGQRRGTYAAANAGFDRGLAAGRQQGRAQQRIAELERRIREADRERAKRSDTRSEAFVQSWSEKDAQLRTFLEELDRRQKERMTAQSKEEDALLGRVGELIDAKRRGLADRLAALYADRADFAVITPGGRERAIMHQGTQRGTVEGEALRIFWQFKSFPAAVITKAFGRELYGGQGRYGAVAGIVHMIVATMLFGYVAMTAKDFLKGRNPRDPNAMATWWAAFLQGGGAGIFGDFFFGDFSRFGRTPLETFVGPGFSEAASLLELWSRFTRGEDFAAQGIRWLISQAPFINLFYTRAALDYLVLYQIQEAMNPGFLRRYERRVQRENNQTFWLPPTSALR